MYGAMWSPRTHALVRAAVDEDLADRGDLSAALLPDGDAPVAARFVPRQAGVICGLALAPLVCREFSQRLAAELRFEPLPAPGAAPAAAVADGGRVAPGQAVALLHGPKATVLTAERTLLNFLGRLSGVATLTRRCVDAARAVNPRVQILDTRKTLPGWRELDKYAVRCGGGSNHRFGLYDAVLIKDNHLAGVATHDLAGALAALLRRLAETAPSPPPAFVEVEADSLAQFEQIVGVPGVDMVLLDNFPPDDLRAAVRRRDALGLAGRVLLEASGGMTEERLAAVAATGVDRISIGALTHSAPQLDLGLDA